ncbi:MAG TPA: FAD-dependent oxidoreductase [Syntrophales bacterium]|nr:FAD-dependent oxidoreductase [Syntrophales bacterium]
MEFPGISFNLSALKAASRPDPEKVYDLLILGGGPAALTAAIYAARKTITLALITKEFGGQVSETSEIENYIGFQTITGTELTNRFVEHVKGFDIPIAEKETIQKVEKDDGLFLVRLQGGAAFRGKTVVFATGKRHRNLNVPGEKELRGRGVAYCSICDAPFFRGKRVVVAGGGNSAVTAAIDLAKLATEITVVNFAAGWQADGILLDNLRRQGHVKMLDNSAVARIEGADRVSAVAIRNRTTGGETTIPADGIFIEIGLFANTEPVRDLAAVSPSGELIVDCACRTSVEGLFGAGDATTVPYNQIVISAGEGAKAALGAYDYLLKKGLI